MSKNGGWKGELDGWFLLNIYPSLYLTIWKWMENQNQAPTQQIFLFFVEEQEQEEVQWAIGRLKVRQTFELGLELHRARGLLYGRTPLRSWWRQYSLLPGSGFVTTTTSRKESSIEDGWRGVNTGNAKT